MKKTFKKLCNLAIVCLLIVITAFDINAQTLPEPDFTAIKEWYNIVKWTYESTGQINIIVSPKNEGPQTHRFFIMRYFDEDGIDVVDTHYTQIIGLGYNTPPSQREKVYAGAPEEYNLKKVKSVAVYRLLEDGSIVPQTSSAKKDGASVIKAKNPTAVNTNNNTPVDCSFNVQPQSKAGTPFSQALIKSLIYERYSFEVNTGGLSSPNKVGVTYLSIQQSSSYTNGGGVHRPQSGAPPNAVIYPFSAKYIVCKQYKNAVTRTQYESNFVSFKANNGNWDCAVDGVPKITNL